MNLCVYNYKIKDTNKYLSILIFHWWMHESNERFPFKDKTHLYPYLYIYYLIGIKLLSNPVFIEDIYSLMVTKILIK